MLGWGGLLRGEIDLSPAAKSHRMRLSDRQHYSQSLWINSTAAPHDPFAFPQTNYLIRRQCMMGKPPECSILTPQHPPTPPDQAGEDLFCKRRAAYR